MKSILRMAWFAGVLLAAAQGLAQDQIPWVADFRTACGMAAEQRRLVLLHFFSDNCGPCVRLEQNVFNKPEVGEAVAQNYLAVKVHAGKNPQLASRYHVNQWPTDVFVTPSGLEVYRTISPREAPDYIALLNQVAQQAGVGTGRNWKNQVAQATQSATAGVAAIAGKTATDAQHVTQQSAAGVHDASNQAQNSLKAAASQFQMAADQARAKSSQVGSAVQQTQQQVSATVEQTQQQAAVAVDQARGTANHWSQQTRDAVDRYEQQGGDAYRQFREKTDQAAQQVQNDAHAARQEWRSTTRQAAEGIGETAQNLKSQWQQGPASSLLDRRSSFVPAESSPAAQPPVAPATGPLPQIVNQPAPPAIAPPRAVPQAKPQLPPATVAANQALLPTENPWVTNRQTEKPSPETPRAETLAITANAAETDKLVASTPPAPASPPASAAPPLATAPQFVPAQPEPPPALPSQAASPPTLADSKLPLVPASQAPPLALDGFCPVTLMETMASNPADRAAWRKGDRKFGAIHRGRTYLFANPEAQQKFLANPDNFAPVLAGCDPVRFAERGEMIDGKRAYGLLTPDKRMVLFADETSRNRFEQSPGSFTPAIQQAMLRGDGGSLYR